MDSEMQLRLLGSGSGHGGCPAVYVCDDTGELVVQGDITDRSGTVLVPHVLIDWLEPAMKLPIEASAAPGAFLVTGEPVTPGIRAKLTLADNETAVVVA
ncbi:hypothetical protein [Nocardia mexicana]|uniref:Uncharacterized protein n=1 Tax=Nocardia mexicana TaxID=279262 RepID=A0A370GGI7_9NOCA|nr:hypothetical protein [Nocardia mexicana]RDI42908.1 hypothetical protein DFR68_12341 [Nocardia mexicana]